MDTAGAQASTSLRLRMGFLAFLAFNLSMGTMWGSFGVLMAAIEVKMGVGRQVSSLAAPLVMVAVALLSPVAGGLTSKLSIRTLMFIGSAMGAAGFGVLALATNIQVVLLAYALLIGPSVCLCGTVLPGTLVTRWFVTGRGRALGFVYIPIAVALTPLISVFVLGSYGLSAVYVLLACFMLVNLVAQALVIDHPPLTSQADGEPARAPLDEAGITTRQLLRSGRFWPVTIAYAANIAGTMMLSAHLVPMAVGWGNAAPRAASLLTVMSLAGMIGPFIFGWLADKLGGQRALAILCLDCAVIWGLLLLHPSFPALVVLIALFGVHSSGGIPAYGLALSEQYGQAGFARAYGLGNMATLPFTVFLIPLAGYVYVRTGSYAIAIGAQASFLLAAALLVMGVRRRVLAPA